MNIGRALKKIREDNFLSKEHLSVLMDCTTVTIRNLETCKTHPSSNYIESFANMMGVTDSYILFLAIDSGHAPDTDGITFQGVKDRIMILLRKGNWVTRNRTVNNKLKKGETINFTYEHKRYEGMVLSVFEKYCIVNVGKKKLLLINRMNQIKTIN